MKCLNLPSLTCSCCHNWCSMFVLVLLVLMFSIFNQFRFIVSFMFLIMYIYILEVLLSFPFPVFVSLSVSLLQHQATLCWAPCSRNRLKHCWSLVDEKNLPTKFTAFFLQQFSSFTLCFHSRLVQAYLPHKREKQDEHPVVESHHLAGGIWWLTQRVGKIHHFPRLNGDPTP